MKKQLQLIIGQVSILFDLEHRSQLQFSILSIIPSLLQQVQFSLIYFVVKIKSISDLLINCNRTRMSQQTPAPEQNPVQPVEQPPKEDEITPEQQEAYNKMMSTLSNMNTKIQKVKSRLAQPTYEKKEKTDEITNKLIQSKESSEIITKQNLLTDITESYEKVVIEVYSENGKLKKKVEEMAKIIKDQNNKLYTHTQRQKDLLHENEQLRSQIAKLKDDKLMLARGHVPNQTTQRETQKQQASGRKKPNQTAINQNQDFDFWSMPQNDYGKKKKDFVQDSNLWVNQKQVQQSVFLTEQQTSATKKKK